MTERVRHLDWDGCFNARDLGGLPASDGRRIRWGAVVRSDGLDDLSSSGWRAVVLHGVRTVIDLRNDDERKPDRSPRPKLITTLRLPLDNTDDDAFWSHYNADWQCGTPLYYAAHVARFPKRSADVIAAIAEAPPGGVVFHCVGGRDRTGMTALLLLSLLGVPHREIVADYLLSRPRLPPLFARRGEPDQGPLIDEFLAARGTCLETVVRTALEAIDLEAWAEAGGLTRSAVDRLQQRVLL